MSADLLLPNGSFVAKMFKARDIDFMLSQMKLFFTSVTSTKPRSSRSSSNEHFIVCLGYRAVDGYEGTMAELGAVKSAVTRFVRDGDLGGFDAGLVRGIKAGMRGGDGVGEHEVATDSLPTVFRDFL
ncbi:putative tRNA (cytidine(32)/guanosine(34)-2'-O)-methyltransferase [Podochytrium sp. JEL0797]|nr:putative tRNA (cytidine(32)/guanosine(34)-2'-O)-methyltransferase [Podochytrium sp. JEL0797]